MVTRHERIGWTTDVSTNGDRRLITLQSACKHCIYRSLYVWLAFWTKIENQSNKKGCLPKPGVNTPLHELHSIHPFPPQLSHSQATLNHQPVKANCYSQRCIQRLCHLHRILALKSVKHMLDRCNAAYWGLEYRPWVNPKFPPLPPQESHSV